MGDAVRTIARQRTGIGALRERARAVPGAPGTALPKSGGHFAGALPQGTRNPGRQVLLPLPDGETLLLAMAAPDGHVAFGWWRVFGDGFHVKLSDCGDYAIPDAWLEGDGRARALDFGRRLVAAVPASRKDRTYARRHWENVDFLERQPGLIEELDRFHIGSLGLDPGTLLPHLRRMRSPDGWDFGQGGPPAP